MATLAFGLPDNPATWGPDEAAKIDALFAGFYQHTHNGIADETLAPEDPPVLTLSATGGVLEPGVTYEYVATLVDVHGRESGPSAVATVEVPDPVSVPGAPAVQFASDAGGTILSGSYYYALAAWDGDNHQETPVGPTARVVVPPGASGATVTLTLPDPPAGAQGWNVYRMAPGGNVLTLLATIADVDDETFTDTGGLPGDPNRQPSTLNASAASSKVTVGYPGGTVPVGYHWKLYRTSVPGFWEASLIHEIVEETAEGSGIITPTFIDTGDAPSVGSPPLASEGTPNPGKILLTDGAEVTGKLPASMIEGGAGGVGAVIVEPDDDDVVQLGAAVTEGGKALYVATPKATGEVFSTDPFKINLLPSEDSPAFYFAVLTAAPSQFDGFQIGDVDPGPEDIYQTNAKPDDPIAFGVLIPTPDIGEGGGYAVHWMTSGGGEAGDTTVLTSGDWVADGSNIVISSAPDGKVWSSGATPPAGITAIKIPSYVGDSGDLKAWRLILGPATFDEEITPILDGTDTVVGELATPSALPSGGVFDIYYASYLGSWTGAAASPIEAEIGVRRFLREDVSGDVFIGTHEVMHLTATGVVSLLTPGGAVPWSWPSSCTVIIDQDGLGPFGWWTVFPPDVTWLNGEGPEEGSGWQANQPDGRIVFRITRDDDASTPDEYVGELLAPPEPPTAPGAAGFWSYRDFGGHQTIYAPGAWDGYPEDMPVGGVDWVPGAHIGPAGYPSYGVSRIAIPDPATDPHHRPWKLIFTEDTTFATPTTPLTDGALGGGAITYSTFDSPDMPDGGIVYFTWDFDAGEWVGTPSVGLSASAVQALIDASIVALQGSAPGTLDTIEEIAAALEDNEDVVVALSDAIALKLPSTSPKLPPDPTLLADGRMLVTESGIYVAKTASQVRAAIDAAEATATTAALATKSGLVAASATRYKSGSYYAVPHVKGGARAVAPGSGWCFPIEVDHAVTISELLVEVTTAAAAGGKAHLYIVGAASDGTPDMTILANSANVAVDAIAVVYGTLAAALGATAARYFGLIHGVIGTATYRAVAATQHLASAPYAAGTNGISSFGFTGLGTSVTPLTNLSGATVAAAANQAPIIAWKAA